MLAARQEHDDADFVVGSGALDALLENAPDTALQKIAIRLDGTAARKGPSVHLALDSLLAWVWSSGLKPDGPGA